MRRGRAIVVATVPKRPPNSFGLEIVIIVVIVVMV